MITFIPIHSLNSKFDFFYETKYLSLESVALPEFFPLVLHKGQEQNRFPEDQGQSQEAKKQHPSCSSLVKHTIVPFNTGLKKDYINCLYTNL